MLHSFCRLLKAPALYGVSTEYREGDPKLLQFRADLVHSAAVTLEKAGMVKYTRSTGKLVTTEIGRIARCVQSSSVLRTLTRSQPLLRHRSLHGRVQLAAAPFGELD
jgi:hypothetical protein